MTGIKAMRAELGISQVELATALQVSFTAVNRWENNRNRPNRSAFTLLINYAKANGVSKSCIEQMQNSFEITRTRQNSNQLSVGCLPPIDRELLCQLVEEAEPAVYVTDAETDELLYANKALEQVIGKNRDAISGKKCYQFLLGRSTPCPHCHKSELTRDKFFFSSVESTVSGQLYSCRAKEIRWNGRVAHVRYLSSIMSDATLQYIACGVCVFAVGTNQKLSIRYANDGFYLLFGDSQRTTQTLFGQDILFGVCPSDRQRVQAFIDRIVSTRASDELIFRTQPLQGVAKWLNVKANYIVGEIVMQDKIFCTFTDVTDSVSNEMQLRSILSQLPVAMIVFTVQNQLLCVQYISENCINISGFTAAETYARSADGLALDAHPEARQYLLEHIKLDIETKKNLSYTFPIRCKNGTYRYVHLSITPVETEGSLLYYGMLRNTDYNGPEKMLVGALPF